MTTAQSSQSDSSLENALAERERVRVLVEFDIPLIAFDSLDAADRRDALDLMDAERDIVISRTFGVSADVLASAPIRVDQPALIHEYRHLPMVAMYLDRAEIDALSNDTAVSRIMLDRLSAPLLDESVGVIGASSLHTAGLTGAGVSIAILDSGVDLQHPMFAGRIRASACFSSSDPNQHAEGLCPNGQTVDTDSAQAGDNCTDLSEDPGTGADGCDHGTHVAGIAAGAEFINPENTQQVLRGVAPGAGIVAVQVFAQINNAATCAPNARCIRTFDGDQIAALDWLLTNRTNFSLAAINMSLGSGAYAHGCDGAPQTSIIRQLRAAGVATVIATGNESFANEIGAPACISDAISVGSSTNSDSLSPFSNSGVITDLVAPGSGIWSAEPTILDIGAGRAGTKDGTSMATPHVAGAFALLRAANPVATVTQIENALEATGTVVTSRRSNISEPRIRVDLAHGQLAAYARGVVGTVNVSAIRPLDALVTVASPASGVATQHSLTNTGTEAVGWTASTTTDWIQFFGGASADTAGPDRALATTSGVLQPGESQALTVHADGTGLAPGVYQGRYGISVDGHSDPLLISASLAIVNTPRNDGFDAALPIVLGAVMPGVTHGTTRETGEPVHAGNGSGASVWYRWDAPVSGDVAILATSTSSLDPVLGVYTGNSVGNLTLIDANDDAEPGNSLAGVQFRAAAGTSYYFALAGADGTVGEAQLVLTVLTPPANDNLADARVLSGATGRTSGYNFAATSQAGEPNPVGAAGDRSVWFAWTAPNDGQVWFDVSGVNFTSVVTAYDATGNVVGAPAVGAVAFQATGGAGYLVSVDGLQGATGQFDLSWSMESVFAHRLRSATLPTVRTAIVGQPTTVFATIANPASFGVDGVDCGIFAPAGFAGEFSYQMTNPATNALTGQPDTLINLPAGASQSYLITFTPSQNLTKRQGPFIPVFRCRNIRSAAPINGLNTVRLLADDYRNGDIISSVATVTGGNRFVLRETGVSAFGLSAINIGFPTSSVQILVQPSHDELPTDIEICETNPATGACITPRSAQAIFDFSSNDARTFSVFIRNAGQVVPFSPAENRYNILYVFDGDTVLGGTSLAASTATP